MFAQDLEAGSRIPFMTENILVVTELVSVVTCCHAFLCLLFNILTDRVTYPSCPIMLKHTPYANRHTNTVQLVVPRAHTNQFKYSFIPSTTERWNGLHFDTNGITSLTSFKHALQHY